MNSIKDLRNIPSNRSVVCYFCNEFFEDKLLQDHIIQCSSVLEPCPKQCGVYVQRSAKERHFMECKFKKPKSTPCSSPINNLDYLEKEIMLLKSALSEEKIYRQEAQISIQKLLNLNRKTEEQIKYLNSVQENIKRICAENIERKKSYNVQTLTDLNKIESQLQLMDIWKKEINSNLDYVNNKLRDNNKCILDSEFIINDHSKRLEVLNHLEMELNWIRNKITDQEKNSLQELQQFKEFFDQENAMIAALWTDQKNDIEDFKQSLEIYKNKLSEFTAKQQSIIFDTKSISQIANESSERLDSQTNEMKQLKQELEQLKQDFKVMEECIRNYSPSVQHGNFIWKIEEFSAKMESAKQHNTVLYSPVLYSTLNGYKLRLEIYLNGIKKWKGRHVIVSLQVLKGEWDSLLQWPCNIQAKLSLRHQAGRQGKNLVKHITAKRLAGDEENEEPQESSSQYIFIPHATLEKQSFIKNDTIFLEIIILNDLSTLSKKSTTDVSTL